LGYPKPFAFSRETLSPSALQPMVGWADGGPLFFDLPDTSAAAFQLKSTCALTLWVKPGKF
jgi:hypothetical protein